MAAKWNLGPHLITRTRVVSIAWNRAENRYHVTTQDDRKDGLTKTWAFDFVIVGTGQLNVPSTPDIPGLQSFKGDQWHSARWRDDISLEGKKVLVIGNGATAAQFVPEVAKVAGNLKVFARSQNWILRRDEYLYGDWHKWALQYVPFLRQMQRFSVWLLADFVLWMAFQNKQFMIKTLQREAEKHLKNLVPGDDEKAVALRKKLTPGNGRLSGP